LSKISKSISIYKALVLLPSAQEVPEHHVEQQNTSEAKLV
jgi:hypothetical protein